MCRFDFKTAQSTGWKSRLRPDNTNGAGQKAGAEVSHDRAT